MGRGENHVCRSMLCGLGKLKNYFGKKERGKPTRPIKSDKEDVSSLRKKKPKGKGTPDGGRKKNKDNSCFSRPQRKVSRRKKKKGGWRRFGDPTRRLSTSSTGPRKKRLSARVGRKDRVLEKKGKKDNCEHGRFTRRKARLQEEWVAFGEGDGCKGGEKRHFKEKRRKKERARRIKRSDW